MTNERARRIVDISDKISARESIAPPPIDRADEESQLEDQPSLEQMPADADAPVENLVETSDIEIADDEDLEDDLAELEVETEETDDDDALVAAADEVESAVDEIDEDSDAGPDGSLPQLLEALLFVADEPIAPSVLARALELTPRQVRRGLDDLADTLRDEHRGVRLQQGPDGTQLVTASEAATAVENFLGIEANRRLSNAALETLAIVAYRQPVTRSSIEAIRGVNSDGSVATLRARGLIEGVGRAPGPGRPLLFSTTQRFLEHFGLERPDDLPPLPEDVELLPEMDGAQLALEATVHDELADDQIPNEETSEGPEEASDQAEMPADQLTLDSELVVEEIGASSADAIDDRDEEAFVDEEIQDEEVEDDADLEISGNLQDLNRAAEAALANWNEPDSGSAG